MIELWVGLGMWFLGAVVTAATVLMTPWEHGPMGRIEWGWFVFNCAIWPMWVIAIGMASVAYYVRRYS